MSKRIARSLIWAGIVMIGLFVFSACGGSAATIVPTTGPAATQAVAVAATPTQSTSAICSKIVNAALDAIKSRCNQLGANQVCYGNTQVDATLTTSTNFKSPGDIVHISDLKTIHTLPYDPSAGTWGIAVLRAAVDLPGTAAGQQVTFLMYGDATLDSASPTMQTVYFHTGIGQQTCQELPPSGMIVQVPHGQHIKFSANGADITLASTALMQAQQNQTFTVSVLEGQGTVSAQGVTQTVNQGYQTQVALQGNTISAPPAPPQPIPFQAVNGAPVTILPEPLTSTQIQQAISAATVQAVTPVSGTAVVSVTPAVTWTPGPTLPSIAGSAKQIAFVSNRNGKNDIYLMNTDGSNVQRLTNTQNNASSPALSPDGSHVAFSLFSGQIRQIYTVKSSASALTPLTPATASADHPSWSPDGSLIAYDTLVNGNRDIWVMNADGSNQHALATDPAEDAEPVWSPDGKSLAFTSTRGGSQQIYVMDSNGGSVKLLTTASGTTRDPSWSPDGKSIAYIAQRNIGSGLFIMNTDASSSKQLAPSVIDAASPSWSSDSTQIAYVSSSEGGQAIYIVSVSGTDAPRRLTPSTSDNSAPSWQR